MSDKSENENACMAKSATRVMCVDVDECTQKSFYTRSGKHFAGLITKWLQNTRLMAEACYRMSKQYDSDPNIVQITHDSWKKTTKDIADSKLTPKEFVLNEPSKGERIRGLLNQVLSTQFILLETLWETYLSELSIEISSVNPELFKDCVDQRYIQETLSDVLTGKLTVLQEVRSDVGRRFAACITRKPWREQWNALSKLGIGLTTKDASQPWYKSLEIYFEMRNLIVHTRGIVSNQLKSLDHYYEKHTKVIIYPQHIDSFRKQFLSCVDYIEEKAKGRMKAQTTVK